MSDEPIGETFARRYRILETLGQGGMGTVYKALDTRFQRLVTLKVLHFAPDAESKERFLREAKALAGLNHPNILQMYDVGEAEGLLYLAFEYVEGRSLQQIIEEGKPLDTDYAIEIGRQLGKALGYAHQRSLVHRDLKPSNILVSNEGRVLLLDFGLAVPSGAETLTQAGRIAGTPAYMSPEQAMGRPVDARSDIFSLGVVLYELLTGRRPFSGQSSAEILRQIVEQDPVPPEQLNSSLSLAPSVREIFGVSSLVEIIVKSLAKAPEQRFQTADKFVSALNGAAKVRAANLQDPQWMGALFPAATATPASARTVPSAAAARSSPVVSRTGLKFGWLAAALTVLLVVSFAVVWLNPRSPWAEWATWFNQHGLRLLVALSAGLALWLLWYLVASRTGPERRKQTPLPAPSDHLPRVRAAYRGRQTRQADLSTPSSPGLRLDLGVLAPTDQAQPTSPEQIVAQRDVTDRQPTDTGLMPYSPAAAAAEALKTYPSAIAWLLVFDGEGHSREVRLGDHVTIGRQSGNDIVLLDNRVSRRHARISLENGRFYIFDLGGRHGTFVNGQPVEKQELRDRDEIQLAGATTLLFIQAASPTELTAEAKRRLREFDSVWDQLTTAARHD